MGRGAWWAAIHGVAKSRTWLSDFTFTFPFHALEKEMATHSSVLAWRIPGTGEPSGLPSMGSHRVGHDWSDLAVQFSFLLLMTAVQLSLFVQVASCPHGLSWDSKLLIKLGNFLNRFPAEPRWEVSLDSQASTGSLNPPLLITQTRAESRLAHCSTTGYFVYPMPSWAWLKIDPIGPFLPVE